MYSDMTQARASAQDLLQLSNRHGLGQVPSRAYPGDTQVRKDEPDSQLVVQLDTIVQQSAYKHSRPFSMMAVDLIH